MKKNQLSRQDEKDIKRRNFLPHVVFWVFLIFLLYLFYRAFAAHPH